MRTNEAAMTYQISYGHGVVSIPEAALAYLDKADPMTLKLYLTLCADKKLCESLDIRALAKSFAVTPEAIENALAFWVNAGLLETESEEGEKKPPKKTPARKSAAVSEKTAENGERVTVVSSDAMPNYTGSEIERIMNDNPDFSRLLDECQALSGKMFGIHEINRVIGLADVLRLDHDSILLLFGYAQTLGKCSVPYVVKMAQGLVNDGIVTFAEVEAYIAGKEKEHTLENVIRRLAGIGGRVLTAKEKKYLTAWLAYDYPEEVFVLAYEVTANNTGEFSFPYMNKILVNWNEAGYRTREEIETALEQYRTAQVSGTKKSTDNGEGSFDLDDFFAAALQRTKKIATDGGES
ncbi:MAG: DnaD domain protein [Clostridia bacterium]|nr:DnaD domain protein [Clostridia bacterium]